VKNIKSRRLLSTVSSLALFSAFFMAGMVRVENVSAALTGRDLMNHNSLEYAKRVGWGPAGDESVLNEAKEAVKKHREGLAERARIEAELQESRRQSLERLQEIQEKENTMAGLSKKVTALTDQLRFATASREETEEKIAALRAELIMAKAHEVRSETEKGDLETETKAQKIKISSLQERLDKLTIDQESKIEEIDLLTQDLQETQSKWEEQSKEMATLRERAAGLEAALLENQAALRQTKELLTALESNFTEQKGAIFAGVRGLVETLNLGDSFSLESYFTNEASFERLVDGMTLGGLFQDLTLDLQTRFSGIESQILILEEQKAQMGKDSEEARRTMAQREAALQEESAQKDRQIEHLNSSLTALEEQIGTLEAERLQLKETLLVREQELGEAKGQNAQLQAEVNALESALKKATAKIEDLEQRIQSLQAEKQSIEESQANLEECLKLTQDMTKKSIATLQEKLESVLAVNEGMKHQLKEAQEALSKIAGGAPDESISQSLGDELAAAERGDTPSPSMADTTSKVAALVKALKSVERELESKLAGTEETVRQLERDKTVQEKVVERFAQQVTQQQQVLDATRQALQEKQSAVEGLHQTLDEKEDVIMGLIQDCDKCNLERMETETQILILRGTMTELTEKEKSLRETISSLQEQLEQERVRVGKFESQLIEIKESLAASVEAIASQRVKESEAEVLVSQAYQEVQKQNENYAREIEKNEVLLAIERGKMIAMQKEMQTMKDSAEKQVDKAYEFLDTQIKAFERVSERLRAELHEKEEEKSLREADLRQQTLRLEALKKLHQELKQKHKELEANYTQAQALVSSLTEQQARQTRAQQSEKVLMERVKAKVETQQQADKSKDSAETLLRELAEARAGLEEVRNQKTSLEELVKTFEEKSQSTAVPKRETAEVGTSPMTPVRGTRPESGADFRTPLPRAEGTMDSPLKSVLRAMTGNPHFAQGIAATLEDFGPIGSKNALSVLEALAQQLNIKLNLTGTPLRSIGNIMSLSGAKMPRRDKKGRVRDQNVAAPLPPFPNQ